MNGAVPEDMNDIHVHCSGAMTSIIQDGSAHWTCTHSLKDCEQELFVRLRALSGRIQLVLDGYLVVKRSLSLEHVPEESRDHILRTQAALLLDIPEELVRYHFAPEIDDGHILRGTLYYCDERDIEALLVRFRSGQVRIDKVSVPDQPSFVLFDMNTVRGRQERERRSALAAVVLALVCGLATHWLQRVVENITEANYAKQQALCAAQKEHKVLTNNALFASKVAMFAAKAGQQHKRFSLLFPALTRVRPADILPQKVFVDCSRNLVEIEGFARTTEAPPVYVERLRRQVLSEATLTSLEHDRTAYRFRIEGALCP